MKNLQYILFFAFFLNACISPKSYLQKGQYDEAVKSVVKKLQKKPNNQEYIDILAEAYPAAVEKDMGKIDYLNREGNPDRWDEIFVIYNRLKKRQELVKIIINRIPSEVFTLDEKDYDGQIINAKRKAADYFYAHAKQLMQNPDKESQREAYKELEKLEKYSTGKYSNIKVLMEQAKENGTNYVMVTVLNNTHYRLGNDFKESLISFGNGRLNSKWTKYYLTPIEKSGNFDYTIYVNLKIVNISPESVKENRFTRSREVEDGWEYVLDERGNVKKDSLGNDIKRPKIKKISCQVIETFQSKSAYIEGTIDYFYNNTNQRIARVPVSADNVFEYVSRVANGNINALNEEMRRTVGNPPVPFPGDIEMIYRAGEFMGESVHEALYDNRSYIK